MILLDWGALRVKGAKDCRADSNAADLKKVCVVIVIFVVLFFTEQSRESRESWAPVA